MRQSGVSALPKCSVFIATSLDGFIARKDGALDWLPSSDGASGGEDYGYKSFFESIDALIFGRKTYELASSFAEWPYTGKSVVVLSSCYPKTLQPISHNVEGTSLPPRNLLSELESRGVQHIYVDGGTTIQSFLRNGLIDELTITRVPVLIGEGISLFGATGHDIRLNHISTKAFPSGFVQSKYRVDNAA